MSKEVVGKYKCSTYWGVPCLVGEDGEMITDVSGVLISLNNQVLEGKLIGVGSTSNLGHGCGSGYSASGIYIKGLEITLTPDDYFVMKVFLNG